MKFISVVLPMRSRILKYAACGLALAFCGQALAEGAVSPEKAIKARQSAYFLMGQQLAHVNATIKGDLAYDKASLELSTDVLLQLSRLVVQSYPPGSDQGSGTKAKPEIWKETAKFNKLAQDAQTEAAKLRTTVSTGDMALIKAAYGATSRSCKACHDIYKEN